jgi:hypothetical protein
MLMTFGILIGIYITGAIITSYALGVLQRLRPSVDNFDIKSGDGISAIFVWPLFWAIMLAASIGNGFVWIFRQCYTLGAKETRIQFPIDTVVLKQQIKRELELDTIMKELDKELGLEPTPIDRSDSTELPRAPRGGTGEVSGPPYNKIPPPRWQ